MIEATIVSTPDCHLCERAKEVLKKATAGTGVRIDEVDWDSAEGRALVQREGIPFPPAVFVNGEFVGYGRLSEGALRRHLRVAG